VSIAIAAPFAEGGRSVADRALAELAEFAGRAREFLWLLSRSLDAHGEPREGEPSRSGVPEVGAPDASSPTGDAGDELSDEALMASYRQGDSAAFEKLFRRYAERIYAVMLKHGMTPDDARDLVQQTFTRMHQARNDFRTGANVRPWLWTIAYNLMRDSMRRRGTRFRAEKGLMQQQASADEMGRGGMDPEMRRALGKALGALSESQREVLVLHYYEGLSFAEIGKIMSVKEGAVRVRAHRAYRRLRELLSTDEEATHAL